MKRILIVIDMQKDFIDGALANPDAQAIVKPMADLISRFYGDIIFTRDTHDYNYLNTTEGQNLPIEHCIDGTIGWTIHQDLIDSARESHPDMRHVYVFNKATFGAASALASQINHSCCSASQIDNATIYVCGTCTDICVVSNVLGLKEQFPETEICVIEDLCAGLTKEKHNAAIEVMKSCQVIVLPSKDVRCGVKNND